MAFDMEIKLLIWLFALLPRNYARWMTIQWWRPEDEIFSKHWHFCHEALSSPFISTTKRTLQLIPGIWGTFIYLWWLHLHVQTKCLNPERTDVMRSVLYSHKCQAIKRSTWPVTTCLPPLLRWKPWTHALLRMFHCDTNSSNYITAASCTMFA